MTAAAPAPSGEPSDRPGMTGPRIHADLGAIGFGVPQIGDAAAAGDPVGVASRAEELGIGTLWVSELVLAPWLDPLVLLAHIAAATRTARLGVAVVLGPLHPPVRLANQLASVDVLSGGRLVAGIGLGSRSFYRRYGVDPERRLARYLDGIELVRRLWTEDEVDFDNGMWRLDGPANVVRPVQRPHPPIFIGARTEQAVRRTIRIGDGWVAAGSAPPDEFVAALSALHRALDEQGRDPGSFPVAKRVYVAVSDDPERDRGRVRAWFGAHYRYAALGDQVAVVGSAAQIADHVADLHARGVHHVVVNPMFDETEQLELLAAALGDR
jgi:alkanesulfonate monooxygenase SsuD/methylene tetrahydromethanopterin reductase-like flavin-dependent oxidoreductase (luciferase family)